VKSWTQILQLGITYILFATFPLAQKETFVPANDVSFTVSTERRSYKAGEQITLKYKGVPLANYAYQLGLAGNRTQVNELSGRQVNYSYDSLYRLTGEVISGGTINGVIGYQYDPGGNRLQRTSTVAPVPPASYSYDANDRLGMDTYDADWNTITSSGSTYGYDFENRLISQNAGAVTIVYDGDGNRVAKTASGTTTKYLIDDRNLTGYAQVLEETFSGTLQRVYTYGLNRISQSQASGTSFYGYDGHGSVRVLTDAAGSVTDRYDYDAFGNIISQVGSTPNVCLYSGEQFDANIGLYYLRSRYYETDFDRFLSPDEWRGVQFDPRSFHRYLYALANPVNRIDPSGQFSLPELVATVSILEILSLHAFDIVKSANVVLIVLNLDRPGFLAQNAAINAIAKTEDPEIVAAAQNLYENGAKLITLAAADVRAANAITDLAKATLTFGTAVANAVFLEQHLARAGGAVLIGLAASDILRKGPPVQNAATILSSELGMPRPTAPEPELNKFYGALFDFYNFADCALTRLLETSQ
jgi:RHS repeat-associated protein